MTRHQWHRTAQALLHAAGSGRRALSSQPPGEPPVTWPLLRRKPSRQNSAQESGMGPDGHLADESAAVAIDETVRPNLRDPAGSLRGTGLSVCGLSPNLAASDFYRLAATELSKWQSTITKVQQQRDSVTLEPTGEYFISFSSVEAATAYRDKLLLQHSVSQHAVSPRSGLWESTLPSSLRTGGDVAQELQNMTIAPGSHPPLEVTAFNNRQLSWTNRLSARLERLGYGSRPPAVLLSVYPPTMFAAKLYDFMWQDNRARKSVWEVSRPQRLAKDAHRQDVGELFDASTQIMPTMDGEEEDGEEGNDKDHEQRRDSQRKLDTLQGQFVVAFPDYAEAQRFQRHWNQRTLNTESVDSPKRHVVQASVIKW